MGEFLSRRSTQNNMQAFLLASMLAAAFGAPSAEPKADAYGFYGHHLYHGPPCKHAFVEETKEVCHIEPEKVCKFPGFHHKKRPAEPHGYIECEKETKEVCKKEPVVEEKSKDFEICHLEPKKVCEEKTFKIPTLDCEEEEEKDE